MKNPVFWLFCTVIDNFGDIGVTWRLACQLRQRFHARLVLWLDDFAALQAIAPDWQQQDIVVLAWKEGGNIDLSDPLPPDVVIEMFACRLPENVAQLIQARGTMWLNWEYLSAEDWAVRTHLMPSLQHNGATKYFWQMGFLPETGGLLREADYAEKQQNFFRQPENANLPENRVLTIFIFAYDSEIWAKWARAWQQSGQAIALKIASKQVIQALKHEGFLPENALNDGESFVSGSLKIEKLDFVPQTEFDARLWAADMLIIRGEDSFVRAQLAGKPFLWHIYPQDEMAHLDKLAAFWRLPRAAYDDGDKTCVAEFQAAFDALSGDLNGAQTLSAQACLTHWQTMFKHLDIWRAQAACWQQQQWALPDSMTRLHDFLLGK